MNRGIPRLAVIALVAFSTQARAQTSTETMEHIDELGRRNEKLQERVKTLEQENVTLRERLRQLGAAVPAPGSGPSPSAPVIGGPKGYEPSPAARTIPLPSPPSSAATVSFSGTIDLDSDPQGAQAATSLGSGCETPCAMEISADGPFTVTFTHPGYAPATVGVQMQTGQPGVSGLKFSPNPVFVQLAPQAKKKPAAAPQKLGPGH